MAIGEVGTFCYQATVDSKALELVQPTLHARDVNGEGRTSLLGPAPQIVLNGDDMAIVASGRDRAVIWKAPFAAGDVVKRFARDADTVRRQLMYVVN